MKDLRVPDPSQITDETMLRLSRAASTAFPDGGITAASLRREADRGRLKIWLIAGKHFTTLGAIKDMQELCRLPAPKAAPNWQPAPKPDHASGITPKDALMAKLERLKASGDQERIAARDARKAEHATSQRKR